MMGASFIFMMVFAFIFLLIGEPALAFSVGLFACLFSIDSKLSRIAKLLERG